MPVLNSVGQRTGVMSGHGVMSKVHVWLGETLCTPDKFSYGFRMISYTL